MNKQSLCCCCVCLIITLFIIFGITASIYTYNPTCTIPSAGLTRVCYIKQKNGKCYAEYDYCSFTGNMAFSSSCPINCSATNKSVVLCQFSDKCSCADCNCLTIPFIP